MMLHVVYIFYSTTELKDGRTCYHVGGRLLSQFRRQLVGGVEVIPHVDVWRKVEHVLLAAAVRHPQERVQVRDG